MRKHILLSTILLIVIAFATNSCEGMDDNFRKYLQERNYSGRIDNLVATPGFERVVLRWVNPTDQRSQRIRILVSGIDEPIEFDTLVNEASIEGLTDATGREFTVFTLDAFGNQSVPVRATAIPVTREFMGNLQAPMPIVMAAGSDQSISFIGATNPLMSFSGRIKYRITASDGTYFEGEANMPDQIGASQANLVIMEQLGITVLPEGIYTVDFSIGVYPIMGGIVTEDAVWLEGSNEVESSGRILANLTMPDFGRYAANYPRAAGGGIGGAEDIHWLFNGGQGRKFLLHGHTPPTVMNGETGITWMQWRMNRASRITSYVLTMANDAQGRDPRTWVIFASNDGENWTEIDRQTNWDPPNRTTRFSRWTFDVPVTEPFYYWRMFVTATQAVGLFQMAGLEFWFDSDAL